jgi:hypothetical protein
MQKPSYWTPFVWLVVLPSAAMLLLITRLEGGAFTYTLDDPYIHLALAKNIMLGNYGINFNETAAPSSSVIWPLLLAPFALLPSVFELAPLAINLLCFSGFIWVLNGLFADLPGIQRLLTMGCVALSLNAFGLIFNGMEHELQLVLASFIVLCLVKRDFRYFYAAAAVLPLVRYEGLAISLPVLAYSCATLDRRKSLLALIAVALCLSAFSIWLERHGLGYLPSSILAKSTHGGISSTVANFGSNLKQYGFVLPAIYWLCLNHWTRDRALSIVIASATLLHLLFGHYGWYGRYEIYWLAFVMLLALRAALDWAAREGHAFRIFAVVLMLPFIFLTLTYDTLTVPVASSNIYNQQARMADIARLLGEPVAVNDLGLVSLRSGVYVLDLWGLGSIEALRARLSRDNSGWIEAAMENRGVKYAFIYDGWFPNRPGSWIRVANLKLLGTKITPDGDVVGLFAADPASAMRLQEVVERYAAANEGTGFRLDIFR